MVFALLLLDCSVIVHRPLVVLQESREREARMAALARNGEMKARAMAKIFRVLENEGKADHDGDVKVPLSLPCALQYALVFRLQLLCSPSES